MDAELSYSKLNPEFKKKWVEALRSGEYIQGISQLHYTDFKDENEIDIIDKYCCLGVACRVLGYTDKQILEYGNIPKSFELVPSELKKDGGTQATLVMMNDEEGKSFNEIADWIEKHL